MIRISPQVAAVFAAMLAATAAAAQSPPAAPAPGTLLTGRRHWSATGQATGPASAD